MKSKSPQIDYFSKQIKQYEKNKIVGLKRSNFRQFGINENNFNIVEKIEDLKKSPPNIIIAQAIINTQYIQNNFKQQNFKKKQKYVMSINLFESMQYDTSRRFKKTGKYVRILKPAEVKFKNVFKQYNGQPLDNKTLLVWRTGGIGDLLFIKPNLDYLKTKYPTCKIKFACGPQYQDMVSNWECVDEVLDLPFTFNQLLNTDYHCIFEGVIERTKEAHTTNAYELFSKWMGLSLPVNKLTPKQKPREEIVNECKNILHQWFVNEKEFILMQVRASSPPRTPNPSFWLKIIDMLTDDGHKIILIDSPSQHSNLMAIKERCKNSDNVHVFSQESKTVAHMIAMASLAKLTISPDSSLIHIAESVGTKNFGVYGPFPGKIRLSTYQNTDWVDSILDCAPCFIHNHLPCKNAILGYSPCYNTIDTNECIDKINGLLKNG